MFVLLVFFVFVLLWFFVCLELVCVLRIRRSSMRSSLIIRLSLNMSIQVSNIMIRIICVFSFMCSSYEPCVVRLMIISSARRIFLLLCCVSLI